MVPHTGKIECPVKTEENVFWTKDGSLLEESSRFKFSDDAKILEIFGYTKDLDGHYSCNVRLFNKIYSQTINVIGHGRQCIIDQS